MKPELYRDKAILAPMVRANSLPFRLLCLKYGADLVYTEELIDFRLSSCKRLENKILGTIDFIDQLGEIVLRICPDLEKDKLILQIGSNDPERAIRAAKLVAQDISGVDFNFGCPKAFSLSGGMGAALLEQPEKVRNLLTAAVEQLPLPVTCKIRLLPDRDRTLDLVKMIEGCGVSALAVHGRTKDQRPRHDNQEEMLREISSVLDKIPLIANGGSNDIRSYSDMLKFRERTKASSVMIARAAMKNPSIFKPDNQLESIENVAREYIKLAIKYDNYVSNSKYSLQTILASGHFEPGFMSTFHACKDMLAICDLFSGLSHWYDANKLSQEQRNGFYERRCLVDPEVDKFISAKQEEITGAGMEFVHDSIPYNRVIYGPKTPRAQLSDYFNLHKDEQDASFDVFQLPPRNQEKSKRSGYYCVINYAKVCYLNTTYSSSKKCAIQATSMLVCARLQMIDLEAYRTRVRSICRGRNVT